MTRPIYIIAADIRRHWSPVNYAAKPYLEGMRSLERISDTYGADSGRSVVAYFPVLCSKRTKAEIQPGDRL